MCAKYFRWAAKLQLGTGVAMRNEAGCWQRFPVGLLVYAVVCLEISHQNCVVATRLVKRSWYCFLASPREYLKDLLFCALPILYVSTCAYMAWLTWLVFCQHSAFILQLVKLMGSFAVALSGMVLLSRLLPSKDYVTPCRNISH